MIYQNLAGKKTRVNPR